MRVTTKSLLRDSYHHLSKCFSFVVLQFHPISLFNRRYCSLDICVIIHIFVFIVFSMLISSFFSEIRISGIRAVFSSFIFLRACPRQDLDKRNWNSNQSSLCKISHDKHEKNSWGMRRRMLE